jgi:hypothetical protein
VVDEVVVFRGDHGALQVVGDLRVGHPLLAPAQLRLARQMRQASERWKVVDCGSTSAMAQCGR